MGALGIIFIIIVTATLWFLYHKIFDVVYFDTLSGIGVELVVCFFISVVLYVILKRFSKVLIIIFLILLAIAAVLALLGFLGGKDSEWSFKHFLMETDITNAQEIEKAIQYIESKKRTSAARKYLE